MYVMFISQSNVKKEVNNPIIHQLLMVKVSVILSEFCAYQNLFLGNWYREKCLTSL